MKFKRKKKNGGTWLAQSVEHTTFDLGVMSMSPVLVLEITYGNIKIILKTEREKKNIL